MREKIKYLLPPILWDFLKRAKSVWLKAKITVHDERVEMLKADFLRLNNQKPIDHIVIRAGIEIKVSPESRNAFEHFCYISPVMVEEMDSFLQNTSNKMFLLDIGALHGIFSLVFASKDPNRRVLAIDASPVAFAKLLYNIHKNQFANIEPIECAVTETPGTLRMHYEWEHAVAAGTTKDREAIEIEASSGDKLCEARGFSPDAIKIDVEGHEVKVLRGLKKTIRKSSPIIFLEVHPSRIAEEGESVAEIEAIFSELNYSAKGIDGKAFALSSIRDSASDERIVLSPSAS